MRYPGDGASAPAGDSPPRPRRPHRFPRSPDTGSRRFGVRSPSFYHVNVLLVARFLAISCRQCTRSPRDPPLDRPTSEPQDGRQLVLAAGSEASSSTPSSVPDDVEDVRRDRALEPPPQARRVRGGASASERRCGCRASACTSSTRTTRSSPTTSRSRSPDGAITAHQVTELLARRLRAAHPVGERAGDRRHGHQLRRDPLRAGPPHGDDPEAEKRDIRDGLARLAEDLEFEHLLVAHGPPIPGEGRERLREFASA